MPIKLITKYFNMLYTCKCFPLDGSNGYKIRCMKGEWKGLSAVSCLCIVLYICCTFNDYTVGIHAVYAILYTMYAMYYINYIYLYTPYYYVYNMCILLVSYRAGKWVRYAIRGK